MRSMRGKVSRCGGVGRHGRASNAAYLALLLISLFKNRDLMP